MTLWHLTGRQKWWALVVCGAALISATNASAIPFFAKRAPGSLAQAQADEGTGSMVSTYAVGVQGGMAFLARNFAGTGSGSALPTNPGIILPVPDTDPVIPAPLPGSMSLLALGLGALGWRLRKR